ncbi:helix-turn-helix domain-containing protein [Streptomyces hydrogenans]|uniref:helix-turn-helix domain-containing protein n=2 Tax=Streptomyces hydrogenans TaxID=1873719 RepID=UPI0035E12D3B
MLTPTGPAASADVPGWEGPTTRLRLLGIRLAALRKRSGLSGEDAGARVGISKATLSRYERAKTKVRWPLVDQLCRVYEASDEERLELVDLAKNSQETGGWWMDFGGDLPEHMRLLLALEDEATHIRQLAGGVIPGLLQTMDYAKSIKTTPGWSLPEEDLGDRLGLRMRRQQILDRDVPPRYDVFLDEAVLRRNVGGPEVMAAQMSQLLKRGGQDAITIQVLPFEGGAYSAGLGSHVIYGGFGGPALDVVFLEHQTGGVFLEHTEALEEYAGGHAYLRQEALDPSASATLIAEARDRFLHLANK